MNNTKAGKKPFPWCCTNCGEQSVYGATVDYVTTMHHELQAHTVKVDGLKTPKCANCGQIMLDSEALDVLTDTFLRQLNLLMPAQIRDLRAKSKLTQNELAAALGISDATVVRLEDGAQIQPRSLDNLMRLFFELPQVRDILTTHQIGSLPRSLAEIPA